MDEVNARCLAVQTEYDEWRSMLTPTQENATENATEGVFASVGSELARVVNVDHR